MTPTINPRDTAEARGMELARQVSAALGATFEFVGDARNYAKARLPDGTHFTYHVDTWKQRLHICPDWPRDSRNDWYRPYGDDRAESVTYAITRDAAAVAKDATRRFFAVYVPQYAAQVERKIAADDYAVASKRTALRLAPLLGNNNVRDAGTYVTGFISGTQIYGTAQASGDTVKLELSSLPVNVAEDIIRSIGQRCGGKDE